MNNLFVSTLFAAVVGGASAQAALINSYDFNDDLTDSLAAGNDLTSLGGSVGGGLYSFDANQGLELIDALPDTSNFGIEMRLRFDEVTGYRKLFDFAVLAEDEGLYVNIGAIEYYVDYVLPASAGSVSAGDFFTVGLERVGGLLTAFLNGTEIFSFNDAGAGVRLSNVINFLVDDSATSQTEASAGAVDYIRIHDDRSTFAPVPVPASLPLLAAGLGLFGLIRRAGSRRRS